MARARLTMHEYATHQQALIGAVMRTSGPVIELGAGDYSTPILHEICAAQKRPLVTCEYRAEWLERFRHLESDRHRIYHVPNWARFMLIDTVRFAVAFIDHSPGERRLVELERLRRAKTEYVVIHDTEPNPAAGYGLEPVLARFRHRRDFPGGTWAPGQLPWTTVVGDQREIWED